MNYSWKYYSETTSVHFTTYEIAPSIAPLSLYRAVDLRVTTYTSFADGSRWDQVKLLVVRVKVKVVAVLDQLLSDLFVSLAR